MRSQCFLSQDKTRIGKPISGDTEPWVMITIYKKEERGKTEVYKLDELFFEK